MQPYYADDWLTILEHVYNNLHVPVPATVLDPFAGSGTVGRVAARLSRRAVLIDLNAAYLGQAMDRNRDIPLGLETGT
jgi:DNA modification methylase